MTAVSRSKVPTLRCGITANFALVPTSANWTGVVFQLDSDLTGFLAEQQQMCCDAVSRFDTNSQTMHDILAAIFKSQAACIAVNMIL